MFQIGQRVRIKQFFSSLTSRPTDILAASGEEGILVGVLDEQDGVLLWLWRSEDGRELAPYESEIEA